MLAILKTFSPPLVGALVLTWISIELLRTPDFSPDQSMAIVVFLFWYVTILVIIQGIRKLQTRKRHVGG
jgi:hypothetical protein